MPRPSPRPLCLPELVSNPQIRADYIQANPPIYGPSCPSPSSSTSFPHVPFSSTSTNDVDSHRASGATLASLTSPVTPASTRTSLSVHNAPWTSDNESKGWGMNLGNLAIRGGDVSDKKPRASWSSALASTKSWFGSSVAVDIKELSTVAQKHSSQKEIKLSPSMITPSSSAPSIYTRPVSSPYPTTSDSSPTGSAHAIRSPRVGTGLRYYTERDPAPVQVRVQIPDPIDPDDYDRPLPPPPPSRHDSNSSTPILATPNRAAKELPEVMSSVYMISPPAVHLAALKDTNIPRDEVTGPLSPPPTPPVHDREHNVPHIRVSSGEDL